MSTFFDIICTKDPKEEIHTSVKGSHHYGSRYAFVVRSVKSSGSGLKGEQQKRIIVDYEIERKKYQCDISEIYIDN